MRSCKIEGCRYNKWKDGYCKIHYNYERIKERNLIISESPFMIHPIIMRPDNNTETTTNDLHQDDIKYHPEKIVHPTARKTLNKLSKKKAGKKQQIASIKKSLQHDFDNKCFFTGLPATDAFHIFPIGKYPEYETAHWNILLSTREINRTWDQGLWKDIITIPNIQWVFKIIWDKDHDPNKLHKGNFYEILKNRKDK